MEKVGKAGRRVSRAGIAAVALGVFAGWITSINLLDLSTLEFVKGLRLFYRFKDIWFGLLKSASFGGSR